MKYVFHARVGPICFRIGSPWRSVIEDLKALYSEYPQVDRLCDYSVRLEPARPWRRWVRPAISISGDHHLPDTLPLPLAHGLLAAEMGMNLQLALGERRYLLLHAASVERDGQALIITGESGAGKSTLSAILAANGWRFMSDEFVLLEPETGHLHAFPRPVSLKNASIAMLEALVSAERFGPRMNGTPKGDVQHLKPGKEALDAMDQVAMPRLILFPRFGFSVAVRDVAPGEVFVRLTQASTNYVVLGERGFAALSHLIKTVPAKAIDYPDGSTALSLVDAL